jgi:energy-coupling factor transporter ATP-binding protein EcfA2
LNTKSGSLRLSKIKFYSGFDTTKGTIPLEIELGKVLILVGPNNSGKSLALREIEQWCSGQDNARKVVDKIDINYPNDGEEALQLLREFETQPPDNQLPQPGQIWVGQHVFNPGQGARHTQINVESFKTQIQNRVLSNLRSSLSVFYTVRLDGRNRFSLVDDKSTGDLQRLPQNHLWALFRDEVSRQRVRKETQEAFNLYFVIDPTGMNIFRIRLSTRAPTSASEEQGLDEAARNFHSKAAHIMEFSDGVQAFVGLLSAVLSLKHKIILLDEPEAFLHPSLARRLGKSMSTIAAERDASLVVATHSAEFVMGCLQNEKNTSVVRLTYDNNKATARMMNSQDLADLMHDPLLRSTGELRALFHRAVIVGESDTDRAFYDEINRRLELKERGIKDALFLNGQNKQTIYRLIEPLRRLGIPAVAVVDLDIIKESGSNWYNLIKACKVDESEWKDLDSLRDKINEAFGQKIGSRTEDLMKSQGLNALDLTEKELGEILLDKLAKYGMFLVPEGEVESWLRHLNVSGHGSDWLVKIFSIIGQNEEDSNYLKPSSDDVWEFLDNISSWIQDANRLGT